MPSIVTVAAGSFVGLWLSTSILCSPILASGSCRRLFDAGPFDNLAVNYLAGIGVFTLAHVVLVFSGALVNLVVRITIGWWFLGVTLVLVAAGWVAVSIGLPRYDRWDPGGGGVDGRPLLGLAGLWYAAWSFVLAGLFAFAWFLRYYPG